jgi:large subunit ribosomal protein L24
MKAGNNISGRFRPKMKIKKNDTVIVLVGSEKDKGKKGRVIDVDVLNNRVLVEGVRIVKRHTKPNAATPNGGIIEKEAYIHASNVALVDPKTGSATRVGKKEMNGKLVRYAKKSGEVIK